MISSTLAICGCTCGIEFSYPREPANEGNLARSGRTDREAEQRQNPHDPCRQPAAAAGVLDLIVAREAGEPVDEAVFERRSAQAVAEIVAQQVAARHRHRQRRRASRSPSYATYVKHRLDGFAWTVGVERGATPVSLDRLRPPRFQTATNSPTPPSRPASARSPTPTAPRSSATSPISRAASTRPCRPKLS